jgi:hypothetical protein
MLPVSYRYGAEKLGVERYEAKIKCDNEASLQLFQTRLGFREVSRSQVFKEVTLELEVASSEVLQKLSCRAPWSIEMVNDDTL